MIQFKSNKHVHALAYQQKKEGKTICGDSFFMNATEDYYICVVADGLGSGEGAFDSSSLISEVVERYQHEEVTEIMNYCNEALRGKRGATISIMKVDVRKKVFSFSSVGNVRFVVYTPSGGFIYPLPVLGYLSGKPQKFKTYSYSYERGSKFLFHTDGLRALGLKSLLKDFHSIEEISNHLEIYTNNKNDDITYIVGQLF